MNKLQSQGIFPSVIYKVFNNKSYARDFLNGKIRFANIYYYKNIEDNKRKDISEGTGHVIYNNTPRQSMFASNEIFIFCFHKSLEAALESNFGDIIVEIKKPKELADNISLWLSKQNDKYYGGIEGIEIEYNYSHKVTKEPDSLEMSKLTYGQKPDSFYKEDEFRFVFIKESTKEEFIVINIESTHNISILPK